MRWAALAVMAALALPATAFAAGFDDPASNDPSQQFDGGGPAVPYDNVQRDDTPNDPDYDRAEPDDPQSGGVDQRLRRALRPVRLRVGADPRPRPATSTRRGPNVGKRQVSGFNAAGAWKVTPRRPARVGRGARHRHQLGQRRACATQVRAERRTSCPRRSRPTTAPGCDGYDLQRQRRARRGRLQGRPARGQRRARPRQDLIRAPGFSNGQRRRRQRLRRRHRGLGLLRRRQRPGGHLELLRGREPRHAAAPRRRSSAATTAQGSIGVCPKCQFVPMRVWDTFVSDQNNFFLAVTYAADNGVEGDRRRRRRALPLRRSPRRRSRYAYEKGVAQVYSGDDLNTGNHNYPAAYNHTMLIQGVAADTEGLGEELPEQRRTTRGIRDQLIGLLDTLGAGTTVPVRHLLPQREHDAVRRQVVDLDARARPARRTPARPRAPRRW